MCEPLKQCKAQPQNLRWAVGKYGICMWSGLNWPRIWYYSGYSNQPLTLMKEEIWFIEQLNNCEILKECSEP
jgi:hypothetical protein